MHQSKRYTKKKTATRYKSSFLLHKNRFKAADKSVWALFIFFVCIALLIVYRLYYIQIVDGEKNRTAIDRQYQNIFADSDSVRGDVYFSYQDGNRLLAATDPPEASRMPSEC